MKLKHTGRGFSLIELMIVIAIIGVIAAIAMPHYQKYQIRAKTTACVETLKGIEAAVEMYMSDYPPTSVPTVSNLATDPFLTFIQQRAYFKNVAPHCGLGGKYQIQPAGVNLGVYDVTCTFHGTLSENLGGSK